MKKTMHKVFALLLAILLVFGSMPLLGTAVFAAGEMDPALAASDALLAKLDAAVKALVDPTNLKYYTDEAILRVADALGGGYSDPDAFLQSALANGGYQYAGDTDAASVSQAVETLRQLMATGADMDETSLGYVTSDGVRAAAIHRDESKAHVEFRVVPLTLNGEAVDDNTVTVLQSGDTVTFAAELETDYPVSAAELPIVFDGTKFSVIENNEFEYVDAFDPDETNGEYDIRDACTDDLIDISVLSPVIKRNYFVECFTAESAAGTYPPAYRTPEYMQQYKIMLVEVMPRTCTRTVPQCFGPENSRLFTFTLRVRRGVSFDGSLSDVGIPADWYATNENPQNLFSVTRAAGMTADGSKPATNGSTSKMAYEVYDIPAQYGQTLSSIPASVRFDGDVHPHDYELDEIVRPTMDDDGYESWVCRICGERLTKEHHYVTVGIVEPTEDEDGYERRVCTSCGDDYTVVIPKPGTPALELSRHTAKTGSFVDVTVTMQNNPGIIALRFGLEYDPTVLELLRVEDGGLLGSNTVAGGETDKTPYWILWEDALANENYTENGTLVTFCFRVRDDAPLGESELKLNFQVEDALNKDLEEQPFITRDSVILVTSGYTGDASGDGIVNMKDVIFIERYLVARMTADDLDMQNADFNRDGKVNLKDLVLLKRYLAGGWGIVI